MTIGISLLFIEKRVEAVRLCAALTEPCLLYTSDAADE